MSQSTEPLSHFQKLRHKFLYKEKELADFLTNFLEQVQAFLDDVAICKEKNVIIEFYDKFLEQLQLFLDEVAYYKEKSMMIEFYDKNGFNATDDDAKRALIDECCDEISCSRPVTDEERNEIIQMSKPSEWTDMMVIGWRPRY